MAKALTIKQEKFCQKYLECGNASEAYRFAYDAEKMKPASVNRKAFEALNNVYISARIDACRHDDEETSAISRSDTVKMLSDAILADLTDYISPGGLVKTKEILAMPIDRRRLIERIEATRDGCKISLISKSGAIERLSKMLGWDAPFKSEVRVDGAAGSELNNLTIAQLEAINEIASKNK